jgi:hypothetical protein
MTDMVRSSFVSASSSAVALAASTLYPSAAAKADDAPAIPRMPPFPEPQPIVVDSATFERARRALDAVAHGTFDRSELLPQLNAFVRPDAFVLGATFIGALGAPQSMFAFEKCITADQTSTYFRVHYAKAILTWIVSVDAADRITGLTLRGAPWGNIFSVVWRNNQY